MTDLPPQHSAAPSRQAAGGSADDVELMAVLEESKELGFLGPGPVRVHVDHARCFLPAVEQAANVLDLGSGGGVPGLVLARALPETSFVLLDAMERRSRFLEHAIAQLGVGDRVTVECGRAEELARRDDLRGRFSVVVTRSFGPPAVTAECAVGFLRPGGRLVVSEPPEPDSDRWPRDATTLLGLGVGERLERGAATVQVLELAGEVDARFPRRTGVPTKRPLF